MHCKKGKSNAESERIKTLKMFVNTSSRKWDFRSVCYYHYHNTSYREWDVRSVCYYVIIMTLVTEWENAPEVEFSPLPQRSHLQNAA